MENCFEKINYIWHRGLIILVPLDILLLVLTYNDYASLRWLYAAHLFALHSHEFEEYVYPGGFRTYFNSIKPFKLDPPNKNYPCTPSMIFIVNIGAWVLVIISFVWYESIPWLGFSIMFIEIVNFVGHCVFNFMNKIYYNPGMLTTVFILTPWMCAVTYFACTTLTSGQLMIAVPAGIGMAVSLPTYGMLARRHFQNSLPKEEKEELTEK